MPKKLHLTFPLEPQSQLRPRAAVSHLTHHIFMYDPKSTHIYKKTLHDLATTLYTDQPLTPALAVEVSFYRKVQKSLSKVEHDRRINGQHRPVVKPDTDNYLKACLDALPGVVWEDDRQIVDLAAHKYYSDEPRIELYVKCLE